MTSAGRSGRPTKKARTAADRPKQEQQPLSRQQLEQFALSYLNRFDCTASKLARHLSERARKLGADEQAASWIQELIERYLASGLLNDARFAKNLASQLNARGKSARAISQKLAMRGVPGEVSTELMTARKQDEPGAELQAAQTFVRKRRLGTFRSAEKRAEYRQKDLASLARQGFSFDVARRALGGGGRNDDGDF